MSNALGIIAGTGELPRLLIHTCRTTAYPFFVVAYYGYTDPALLDDDTIPHCWLNLGHIGKTLDALHAHQVKDIVFAGGGQTQRPSLRNLSLDKEGRTLLARIGLRWLGDNRILVTVSDFLEEKGFCVKSPTAFLTQLIPPAGLWTTRAPEPQALQDIHHGRALLEALSPFDFGQGTAIEEGLVLGIEAAEGTDACIRRCGPLKRYSGKAVYIKHAKKGQDDRLDLPVIGPDTIDALIEAGFSGMACQAGRTIVLSFDTVCHKANQAHLFLLAE